MAQGEFRGGPRGSAMISGVTFRPRPVVYSEIGGLAIFEGDIVLGTLDELDRQRAEAREQAAAGDVASAIGISGTRFRWPSALIPYEIDPALPDQQRVREAIAHWEANTRIRFTPRDERHANHVRFADEGGCWSFVGMQGAGAQTISLGEACTTGNAIHEIGHAVGLWHEQSREDRDMFVRVNWASIEPGMEHNFDQHITDGDDVAGYDYGSIMHYPRTAFSADGTETITPLEEKAEIGQRVRLSVGDVSGVHRLYAAILGA
ncbi:M12 family metallopeptidase [Actinoplanes sp. NPDC051851]|uniref:M12 family metallopeptidase n=1 Tax=Actinoplanes sp. NPDC051851 TaxID=3154753 RepID=UPI0034182A88